jgi:hypothetical protein
MGGRGASSGMTREARVWVEGLFGCCSGFTKIPLFSVVPTMGLLGCFIILSRKSGGAGELGAGSEKNWL